MPFPPDSVLLDTGWGDGAPRPARLFTAPAHVLMAHTLDEVAPLLAELDGITGGGRFAAGYLAYEAGYAFEQIAPLRPLAGPLAWFGVYDAPEDLDEDEVEALLAEGGAYRLTEPTFALDRETYRRRVERVRHHIREGDVYQINLTAPFQFGAAGDPVGLYRALRHRQRVGYGALLRTSDGTGEAWVLSRSPELFFRRDGDRVTTRPMKGTVRRGPTAAEDEAQAAWLTADEKNRAENLMIVDLLRNDLSVVAEPGSVVVPALFEAERYDTLWQMTSTVEARLRPGVGTADLVRALFPCGSVTGAPKIRAMQLIHELEDEPRGVYCGAVGVVAPGGRAVFNVPIRTVTVRDGAGTMGSGSGIVWDSEPEAEYAECLLKARFLTDEAPAFALLETIRWDAGFALLDRHLDRMRRAAAYFDFPFDEAAVRERLAETGARLGSEVHRVRLTLDRRGRVEVQTMPLAEAPLRLRRVAVYPEPADSADPFLRHKTTHRPFYDRALAWATERGVDEAILTNERGEITEGTRTNLFARLDGRMWTPPLASGGLGGVLRAHLVATGEAGERVLRPEDLERADAVYLGNALRGLQALVVSSPLSAD